MTYTHTISDAAYFHQRAEVELKRANEARSPEAARAHYLLAGHYLNRAFTDPNYAATFDSPRGNPLGAYALEPRAIASDTFAKAQALSYEAAHLQRRSDSRQ